MVSTSLMQYPFSQMIWQLLFQTIGLTKNGSSRSVTMHLAEFWWLSTRYGTMKFALFLPARKATRQERQQYEEG
jgi:hypothetical protein